MEKRECTKRWLLTFKPIKITERITIMMCYQLLNWKGKSSMCCLCLYYKFKQCVERQAETIVNRSDNNVLSNPKWHFFFDIIFLQTQTTWYQQVWQWQESSPDRNFRFFLRLWARVSCKTKLCFQSKLLNSLAPGCEKDSFTILNWSNKPQQAEKSIKVNFIADSRNQNKRFFQNRFANLLVNQSCELKAHCESFLRAMFTSFMTIIAEWFTKW